MTQLRFACTQGELIEEPPLPLEGKPCRHCRELTQDASGLCASCMRKMQCNHAYGLPVREAKGRQIFILTCHKCQVTLSARSSSAAMVLYRRWNRGE